MKKILIIVLLIFLIILPTYCFADEISQSEIIESQKDSVNISDFLEQAKEYTADVFKDTDYNDILNSAVTGNINNEKIGKSILDILGKETIGSIKTIVSIIVVI